jgi:formylglycine-generating enzyme required for sulfatase activity
VWALEDRVAELRRAQRLEENEFEQRLRAALSRDPRNAAARAGLADHHQAKVRAAEQRGAGDEAAVHLNLLARYDDGSRRAFLDGHARLTVRTDPPGAEVRIAPIVERDRQRRPGAARPLGTAPLTARVDAGHHVLYLTLPGRAPVTHPVSIERGEAFGEDLPPVYLPPADALGPDDCYVPAGYFWAGGAPKAIDPLPGRRVWVDGFVIKRFPVTNGEYLDFLNALVAAGRGEEAEAFAPGTGQGSGEDDSLRYARQASGEYGLVALRDEATAIERWPVVQITWHAANAFAAWRGQLDGRPWRLPTGLEREKAGRGTDGRAFPWGDLAEPTWACVANSRPTAASRAPVEAFPTDCSVYGVRGLAGGVRDWYCSRYGRSWGDVCATSPQPESHWIDARGGIWAGSVDAARAASRFVGRADQRFMALGLRLVRRIGDGLAVLAAGA